MWTKFDFLWYFYIIQHVATTIAVAISVRGAANSLHSVFNSRQLHINNRMFSLYPTSRRSSSSDDDSAANRPPLPAGYIPNHQQNQHRPNPSRVKRALFGPTDHEENRKFVRAELSRHQEEAVKRWNFDFERGCPLEGKLEWQAIPAAERHPAYNLSRMPYLGTHEEVENRENRLSSQPPSGCDSVSATPRLAGSSSALDPPAAALVGSLNDLRTPASSATSGESSSVQSKDSATAAISVTTAGSSTSHFLPSTSSSSGSSRSSRGSSSSSSNSSKQSRLTATTTSNASTTSSLVDPTGGRLQPNCIATSRQNTLHQNPTTVEGGGERADALRGLSHLSDQQQQEKLHQQQPDLDARRKTKEQKLTELYAAQRPRTSRSKSATKLKRLKTPAPSSSSTDHRSPSVKSRTTVASRHPISAVKTDDSSDWVRSLYCTHYGVRTRCGHVTFVLCTTVFCDSHCNEH